MLNKNGTGHLTYTSLKILVTTEERKLIALRKENNTMRPHHPSLPHRIRAYLELNTKVVL
jgi:hypothetical protein